ncbi:MAG: hypothetical protein LUG93_10190 [Lachnospiraceae bacterium]|nr:hypothetical protein [Lachnospiraceae bacterium]
MSHDLRVLTGIPIQYFLIPGYLIALALSGIVPKMPVCQTKMKLFSSCGHASDDLSACAGKKTDARMGKMDQEMLVKLIAQEVQKQLHNRS